MAMPIVVGVSAAAASGVGAITPAFPSGYSAVADDVALTFCGTGSADTLTPPTGWAQVITQALTTGTTTKLTVIWRRLVAGDTAPTIADAGNHDVGRMIIVRGCVISGNPWDFAVSTTETVADTSVSIPGSTQTATDCLVLSAFATGQSVASTAGANTWANGSLANGAEQMDNWVTSGTGGGFAMYSGEKATAGTVSATTCTLALTANFKALMMIALKGAVNTDPRGPLMRSPRPSENSAVSGPYAVPNVSTIIGG